MKTVKLAVLGLNHGYKFADDARRLPGVELIAVAGNAALAGERARELDVPLYPDYRDLINDCTLDGAIVALPNRLHREAVEMCAHKGVHILLEKPIADTVEDGHAIVEACARNKVRLLVGHHRRFSNKVIKLKEVISSGRIGDLVGVNMLWVLAKDRPYFRENWRIAKGGGPLLINGIHDIDNLRYVTGAEIAGVYAATRNRIRNNPVEDSASIILETSAGATVNYFLSDGVPSPWSYELNVAENSKFVRSKGDCYCFFGAKGTVAFPSLNIYTYREEDYGWYGRLVTEKPDVADNDPLAAELAHFIQVVRGDAEPLVTGEDALETLRVLEAIAESARRKQRISLRWDTV